MNMKQTVKCKNIIIKTGVSNGDNSSEEEQIGLTLVWTRKGVHTKDLLNKKQTHKGQISQLFSDLHFVARIFFSYKNNFKINVAFT